MKLSVIVPVYNEKTILLINPPRSLENDNIWKNIASSTPPFGLALLAAILEQENIGCDILDCEAEHLLLDTIIERIKSHNYRFVGITSTTVTIEIALALTREIKKHFPDITTILGGVHPSIFYKELIEEPYIDFIIRNEGEKPLLDLLQGKELRSIANLSYKVDGQVRHNPENTELYDLAKQPPLAYHKLPMDKYYSARGSYKRKPSLGMIVSRGCPGRCTFCFSGMFGSAIRFMPARMIVNEIKYLQQKYGIKEISFYDDTFTSQRKNVVEFCRMLITEKVDLTWSCFARVDTVDRETLQIMKKAGCHQIMYGIESGNEQILKNINKRVDLKRNAEAVKMTQEAGINVRAAFMLGNPGETEATIRETIAYAIKLEPDIALFNITVPYPGTAMFKWAKENGYLLTEQWSEYDLSEPIMRLPTIDEGTVKRYYKIAFRRFYFRTGYLLRKILRIRSFEDIKMNVSAFVSLLKFNST